jgi:PIN domain nuclease of toxin-antitoxin system
MTLLLDTHAIIWWLGADRRLSVNARDAIERAAGRVVISAVTIWEASIKRAAGQLAGPDLLGAVTAAGIPVLAIDAQHGKLAGELPLLHRDPFDRMLVAQAMIEGLAVVTTVAEIRRYGVPVVW